MEKNDLVPMVMKNAESRLSSQVADSEMQVAGYNILHLDPTDLKTTDLLLYFASSMNCIRMHGLETSRVEFIWLKVSIKHSKPFLVGFRICLPKPLRIYRIAGTI